jgi:hypothetical protein
MRSKNCARGDFLFIYLKILMEVFWNSKKNSEKSNNNLYEETIII